MGNVLLIAEHLHGKFPKTTLNGLTAAKQAAQLVGGKAIALVLADKTDALASDLAGYGVDVGAEHRRAAGPAGLLGQHLAGPQGHQGDLRELLVLVLRENKHVHIVAPCESKGGDRLR